MSGQILVKPGDVLTIAVDISSWKASGAALASAEWTDSPSLTLVDDGDSGDVTTATISAFVRNTVYRINAVITNDNGEKKTGEWVFRCGD